MEFKKKPMVLKSPYGDVSLKRNIHGVPEVYAQTEPALYYGQGFVQMNDRQLQAYMLKIIFSGRASEFLNPGLVGVDEYIRSFPFLLEPEKELSKMPAAALANLNAFCEGCNAWFDGNAPRWEWKLLGYKPDAWKPEDVLRIVNAFGYVGLTDLNTTAKKFVVQMIQNDVSAEQIRSLFSRIQGQIDYGLLKKLKLGPMVVPEQIKWLVPGFSASNNWVVSPERANGTTLFANDPHLQIDRLPAIWQEMVLNLSGHIFKGFTVPGIPGPVVGRTPDLAWGPTASFMDMLEYRIEEIHDGQYRRGDKWFSLKKRVEEIRIKKKAAKTVIYWETEHGLLEGYNEHGYADGYYLCLHYSAAKNVGATEITSIFELLQCKTVKEGMEKFRTFESPSFNWVFADRSGQIGYQMSGRAIARTKENDGLIPQSAWDKEPVIWLPQDQLPQSYNPKEGYIVTANEDMARFSTHNVQTIPMATYRADRITELLTKNPSLDIEDLKKIQLDVYSLQAKLLLNQARPFLAKMDNGNALNQWDLRYDGESIGAVYFESYYRKLIELVFGTKQIGTAAFDYLWSETNIFNFLFGYFDGVLLKEESPWFTKQEKSEYIATALKHALSRKPQRMKNIRKITMKHIFFGNVLPSFLGFDRGPFFFAGSRATVNQGQFFRYGEMDTSFCPSFRMVAQMKDDFVHTNLVGGVSDRRFSRFYVNDLKNYLQGIYKKS